jgi:polyhydroxyalkanoate synthesis regulator phasin
MEPYTIRLDPDEMEQLGREAEERGFGNRTEYIRWIIRNRPAIEPSTAESLDERMDELEERLDRIENQSEK